MDNKQKKEYILKTWNNSSGKRISIMLKKYWELREKNSAQNLFEEAKEIFGSNQTISTQAQITP